MNYTGERMMPNVPGTEHRFQEHIVRYAFVAQFCINKIVLDLGCGSGYGSSYLKHYGAKKVNGLDNSSEAIAYCKKMYSSCHFTQGNATSMPYKNHSFDVVVCFELIEHLKDHEALLAEIKRVLKKGGVLIMSTPNKETIPPGNPFHFKELTEKEYITLLNLFFQSNQLFYEYYPYTIIIRDKHSDIVTYTSEMSLDRVPDFFVSVSTNAKEPPHASGLIKEFKHKTFPFKSISGHLVSLFRKIKEMRKRF